ncbi:class I SAM-dependent methyltransferase [Rhizosphaericola mali]|uniref:Class I SAM-dependent methyltransferase n=1 Tax=Rhizosphaericola mali TaxID=2545455 RepID=A0A5P2G103_9BACT|nr:class I SAM-dependent methyltransferase [Rhizosphaericola mali]QES87522.1 class I SAM-dependent methyltransferase [Rhizosphaericola mali]
MSRNNYDLLAPYYDFICTLVYGKNILRIQEELLQYIPPNMSLLLVGGGNGKILKSIEKLSISNLKITYIEASKKMVELSRKNGAGLENVEYLAQYLEDAHLTEQFDYIFTPFFFDNFQLEKIEFLFSNLDKHLKKEGIWLYADFNVTATKKNYWNAFLLKTMYLFFKIVSKIETQELIYLRPIFEKNNYQLQKEVFKYGQFIYGQVYKKL